MIQRIASVLLAAALVLPSASSAPQRKKEKPKQEDGDEIVLRFREKNPVTGKVMWMTPQLTFQTVVDLPCRFFFRVTHKGTVVTVPTIRVVDPAKLEASTDDEGLVTLGILKEGESSVTVSYGKAEKKLETNAIRSDGKCQCTVSVQ
jgi:hypothetical protein